MKIVFFGTGVFGLPSLEALLRSRHKILSIVTSHDKPSGRDLKVTSSHVKSWALKQGLPIFAYDDINSPQSIERLKALDADIFVVIAFGVIFSEKLIHTPKLMMLNVHSSLLPRYRGAAPIHWAMINGDPETGVTVQRVAWKLDTGDILTQKKTPITPEDDLHSLEMRLAGLGSEALLEGLEALERGTAKFVRQDDSTGIYARKLAKEDGHIDWSLPRTAIFNRYRAMIRWPGSYFFYNGTRVIVSEVRITDLPKPEHAIPGTVITEDPAGGVLVACGDGALCLKKLKAEGKKELLARDFLNGFPLPKGAHLE